MKIRAVPPRGSNSRLGRPGALMGRRRSAENAIIRVLFANLAFGLLLRAPRSRTATSGSRPRSAAGHTRLEFAGGGRAPRVAPDSLMDILTPQPTIVEQAYRAI